MAIFGVIAKFAIPHFDARRMQIMNAQRLAIASLRLARTNAVTKSVHYQVSFPNATQMRVSRMVENPAGSGTWQIDDTTTQTISIPTPAQFKSSAFGKSVEFNSRGFAVNLNNSLQIDAQDTFGVTKSIQIWPSGQVNEF